MAVELAFFHLIIAIGVLPFATKFLAELFHGIKPLIDAGVGASSGAPTKQIYTVAIADTTIIKPLWLWISCKKDTPDPAQQAKSTEPLT